MAISQRLVDPYREIRAPASYSWQGSYHAAVLETDWTKMLERVQTAESEIHARRLVLAQDHAGTVEERESLVNAMTALRILRTDAASWSHWQSPAHIEEGSQSRVLRQSRSEGKRDEP